MSDASQSHLYILVHASEPMFKIGIANSVEERVRQIGQRVNLAASKLARGSRDAVSKAEKILHVMLRESRIAKISGSGGTEWFDSARMQDAMQLFKTVRDMTGLSDLEGIKVPHRPARKIARPIERYIEGLEHPSDANHQSGNAHTIQSIRDFVQKAKSLGGVLRPSSSGAYQAGAVEMALPRNDDTERFNDDWLYASKFCLFERNRFLNLTPGGSDDHEEIVIEFAHPMALRGKIGLAITVEMCDLFEAALTLTNSNYA